MESKHTPEPWKSFEETNRNLVAGPDQRKVCDVWTSDRPDAERHAIAVRIVSCVNGCKGINPDAVPGMYDALNIAFDLLESGDVTASDTNAAFRVTEAQRVIRAALATAEGRD